MAVAPDGPGQAATGPGAHAPVESTALVEPTAPVEPVDPHMPDPALKAESVMLESARQRLTAGDAPAALTRLARHRARFPDGRLAEERDVLEIKALIAAGRLDDARRRARAFVTRHPESPYRRALQPVLDAAERP